MAVLIEVLCVVIRRDALERAFPGGWVAFRQIPALNRALRSDSHLISIGFMVLADAEAYISTLEAAGLIFRRDGQALDLAMVSCHVSTRCPHGMAQAGGWWLHSQPPVIPLGHYAR